MTEYAEPSSVPRSIRIAPLAPRALRSELGSRGVPGRAQLAMRCVANARGQIFRRDTWLQSGVLPGLHDRMKHLLAAQREMLARPGRHHEFARAHILPDFPAAVFNDRKDAIRFSRAARAVAALVFAEVVCAFDAPTSRLNGVCAFARFKPLASQPSARLLGVRAVERQRRRRLDLAKIVTASHPQILMLKVWAD